MMNKYVISDPYNTLDDYIKSALHKSPSDEKMWVFLAEESVSSNGNLKLSIIEGCEAKEEWYLRQEYSNITIRSDVILALIRICKRLNKALVIAHTHPQTDLFPSWMKVKKNAGFSREDYTFMKSVVEVMHRNDCAEHAAAFLLLDDGYYSAVVFSKGVTNVATVEKAETYGFLQRDNGEEYVV